MTNIPQPRTVEQVRESLARAKQQGTDKQFAHLLLKHGRLTDEAIQHVIAYCEHIRQCEAYGIARTDA